MANRTHPIVVATRVTQRERAIIDAAAGVAGVPISTLVRDIVVPEASRRLKASADAILGGGG